jgi:sterol desaturase/sphingolipid hydroxylase (fatty acid hydroxylase superfamily)
MDQIWRVILDLSQYPLDAEKRRFWGYALVALFFAFFILWRRTLDYKLVFKAIFNPKVWWHQSAKVDYQLWLVNIIIAPILITPFVITMVPVAELTSSLLTSGFNIKATTLWSSESIAILLTLVLFVSDDFSRFFLHYLMHKVPLLWRFHKVHHSAQVLTPMTVYRAHPVERFLYACRMGLTQGIVIGVFYAFIGNALTAYDILGANIFTFIFNMLGSNLRHSHIWLTYPRWLEKWLISPAQHQIHHGANKAYYDKNMGAFIALWDRWFNTLIITDGIKQPAFGLNKTQRDVHQNILDAYIEPFQISTKRRAIRMVADINSTS